MNSFDHKFQQFKEDCKNTFKQINNVTRTKRINKRNIINKIYKNGITIEKKIYLFLEMHQKMNPKQHGFRSGRSCLSQLPERHNKILEELEKLNNVDVII